MTGFADHFSVAAADYATYRPRYPEQLFAWLAAQAPGHACVWDCGTGNGQAALALTRQFGYVVASDASAAQVSRAPRHERVGYLVMPAERVALASGSASLVSVAQALHWFDRPAFYAEALRVLRPGGLLAVWSYSLASVDPVVDHLIARFHHDTLGPWWPPERALVDAGYAAIDFPLPELPAPAFRMEARWTLPQLAGYLATWSAVLRMRTATGTDPVAPLVRSLAEAWGDPSSVRPVRWPLTLRVGRR